MTPIWHLEFAPSIRKDLKKMDAPHRAKILEFLEKKVSQTSNLKTHGKPLKGNYAGVWSFRTGNYRVIAHIQQEKRIMVILKVAHRKEVYR